MSSPLDLTSGMNSRAVYKECHGDHSICQFDAHKFPYSWISVLQPYPMVGQVTDALWWHYHPELISLQIVERASFGTTLAGEPSFDERCWHCDAFSELYNDNALWAYLIQVSEEICIADHTKVKDPVLHRLMVMGAWDWDKKEGAELHQATRAMRFSTALVSRLVTRILGLEAKVMKHRFIIRLGWCFFVGWYTQS